MDDEDDLERFRRQLDQLQFPISSYGAATKPATTKKIQVLDITATNPPFLQTSPPEVDNPGTQQFLDSVDTSESTLRVPLARAPDSEIHVYDTSGSAVARTHFFGFMTPSILHRWLSMIFRDPGVP